MSVHGNRLAVDLLTNLYEQAGLRTRVQPGGEHDANVLAGPGGCPAAPGGLLLVTHLDTVPPGPREKWQTDPFELTLQDGWLVGLGCADVKLDALCKLEAAKRLRKVALRRPFWLLGTWGEEIGLRGAQQFAQSELFTEIAPSQVLCGEPSELEVISAHKGYAVVRVEVTDGRARTVALQGLAAEELTFSGKAAHSSTPQLGVNAIAKALAWSKASGTPVLAAAGGTSTNVVPSRCVLTVASPRDEGQPRPDEARLVQAEGERANLWRALATAQALAELWQSMLPAGSDARFDPAGAVGGLNVLESGERSIAVTLDARLLPNHDPDVLLQNYRIEAERWVARLGRGELSVAITTLRNASGMAMADDAALIAGCSRVLGTKAKAKPTSTEGGVFARAGCEAAVFGPGRSTGNAHTANERIEISQLERAIDLYERLIPELCGRL